MQIFFATVQIARDALAGGTDAIEGFLPVLKPSLQPGGFLRAPNATTFDRFNRKTSLSGKVTPKDYATLGEATQAALLYPNMIPNKGALVIRNDGRETTFADAGLSELRVERLGVTIMVTFSFELGIGQDTTSDSPSPALTDGTGADLTDGTGAPITSA